VNIASIIRDLLLRNEQLVIPGFGTFKIRHRPAQISKTTQLLIPPSKELLFDSHLTTGDNQLLLAIKKKQGLSESETSESLNKFIYQLEDEIRSKGSVLIEGLGKLSRDGTGSLRFEPVDDLLNLGGVFALPKLEIPVSEIKAAPKITEPVRTVLPAPVIRRHRKWWIPAAAIVLLAAAGSLAYVAGIFDTIPGLKQTQKTAAVKNNNPKRIVFGNRETVKRDTTREAVSAQLDQRTARENALRYEENKQKRASDSVLKYPTMVEPATATGPYQIISGSFTIVQNAERQRAQLQKKGVHAELLPHRGKYYMVSLGAYPTTEMAEAALKEFREKLDQDLWVMKISNE
jgi:nucleoid DNA-binding protein